ncbi:MAG: 3-ketoacyl-ACP reductase [Terrimicrobiaceae bacterium]|nr:3-ketoacyl-ACP reductase [Terrimicrobiaceae bacterium]
MSSPAVVLVTGSSRGLGRGVAEALAAAGYSVAIHYASNRAAAEEAAAACRALATDPGQQFAIVGGNVGVAADRERIFSETLSQLVRLDALVNNAGIAPRERADLTEATEEIFDEVIGVNLKGPYFLSQLAARHWLSQPGASRLATGYKLIFISSLSANTASINRGEYCISKAGLAMATQLWAVRLAAEGIQVMELRPGIMATDMTSGVKGKYDRLLSEGLVPQMRWGTPGDVGLAVQSILAGQFPFSTGDAINIDGGFHLRRL